jgi:hypothetical protein
MVRRVNIVFADVCRSQVLRRTLDVDAALLSDDESRVESNPLVCGTTKSNICFVVKPLDSWEEGSHLLGGKR